MTNFRKELTATSGFKSIVSVRKSSALFTDNLNVLRYFFGKSFRLFVTIILALVLIAAAKTWRSFYLGVSNYQAPVVDRESYLEYSLSPEVNLLMTTIF